MNTTHGTRSTPASGAGRFAPTRWTLVLQARGQSIEAQTALGVLCSSYWLPVFCFIRREGRDDETARELTQEFFARVLARHGFESFDPGRGRFRSFLLGAVKHFLADQRDRDRAAKRGSGRAPVPLDAAGDDNTAARIQIADPAGQPADAVFDRQWALTIVGRALDALSAEFAAAGKAEQFEVLKSWLPGGMDPVAQAEAARQLEVSEGALKVAIHRLRKRFRELVKEEIASTMQDSAQVEEELRYLVEVLGSET